jgi:hypothetical protein
VRRASKTDRRSRTKSPVSCHLSVATLLLLAGCGVTETVRTQQVFYGDRNYVIGTNYLTFEHAFTEAGEADAKRRADSQCAQRMRSAVKTENRCTLKSCITSYQCMTPEEASKYPTDGGKR